MLAALCPEHKAFLQDLKARKVTITAYDKVTFHNPYYDGTKWTTKPEPLYGMTQGKDITLIRSKSSAEDASTVYHEGLHTGQPDSMPPNEAEYEAWTKEDVWRASRGLPPGDPSFRGSDGKTNPAAVRAYVDKTYVGLPKSTTPGGPTETIVGSDAAGNTIVRRSDSTTPITRPPKAGDTYSADGPVTEPAKGIEVDMCQLQCP